MDRLFEYSHAQYIYKEGVRWQWQNKVAVVVVNKAAAAVRRVARAAAVVSKAAAARRVAKAAAAVSKVAVAAAAVTDNHN